MSNNETYERVYTGSEVNVQYLQAGFGGGIPGQVQLFVIKSHFDEAAAIVKATFPNDVAEHE